MPRKDRKGDPHQSPLAEPNSHPQNARTGEALANLRVIVSLFGGGTHEFTEHAGRHIEKLIEKSKVKRSAFRHRGRGRKFVSVIIVRANPLVGTEILIPCSEGLIFEAKKWGRRSFLPRPSNALRRYFRPYWKKMDDPSFRLIWK